jgi:O-phosphoseryl-tRNA(Sec) selenium transferase
VCTSFENTALIAISRAYCNHSSHAQAHTLAQFTQPRILHTQSTRSLTNSFPPTTTPGLLLLLLILVPSIRYVIWPRIDQKSCFKAITTAGFVPIVIENTLNGDEVSCNPSAIDSKIKELGADSVVAVVTTTSCFAPRAPDALVEVAVLCAAAGVPHVVNNAYGLQSTKCVYRCMRSPARLLLGTFPLHQEKKDLASTLLLAILPSHTVLSPEPDA